MTDLCEISEGSVDGIDYNGWTRFCEVSVSDWFRADGLYHYGPPGPLFIRRADILPQHIVKSLSRAIWVKAFPITLKFDRHIGNSAAEMPVKFQSDTIIITSNLAASSDSIIIASNLAASILRGIWWNRIEAMVWCCVYNSVHTLLFFFVVCYPSVYQYPSGLLHWHLLHCHRSNTEWYTHHKNPQKLEYAQQNKTQPNRVYIMMGWGWGRHWVGGWGGVGVG